MVPPNHPQSNRPFGPSPVPVGKNATVEDAPEDQRPSGYKDNAPGFRAQIQDESHHNGPNGERHSGQGHPSRQQVSHREHSSERGHGTNNKQPSRDQRAEQKPREGTPQIHEKQQFSAPAVGAAPLNPGVFLHTSTNPTMALGYTQTNSFVPNQVVTTHASAGANTAATFPPALGNPHQSTAQDPQFDASLPHNTTYISVPNMTYHHSVHFQHGAPDHPQGLHFQPPVPDTTYGPMTHIYVPRHDGAGPQGVVSRGPVQVPLQPQVTVGTNPTLTVHHQAPMPTVQQHVAAQPGVFLGGQAMPGTYPVQPAQSQAIYAAAPGMAPGIQGIPGSVTAHLPPDVTGIGKTIAEIQAYHHDVAITNNILVPEDFRPASKDPAKMYYCRELDGNWTLRSRFSIDKMGDWRWYQTPEGIFYAVRLPN